jgi:hypothetical protein
MAEHDPRTLRAGDRLEPRFSIADEDLVVEEARRRNQRMAREELVATLANMRRELETVRVQLGRLMPGNHRSLFRSIEYGLRAIEKIL